jgi:hypothetical protein
MLSIRRCSKCELGSSGDTEGLGGGVGYSSKGQHFDLFVGWLIQNCSDDFAKFVVLFCLGKEHAHPIAALELHILMHPLSAQNCLSGRWQRLVAAHLKEGCGTRRFQTGFRLMTTKSRIL